MLQYQEASVLLSGSPSVPDALDVDSAGVATGLQFVMPAHSRMSSVYLD
jgi:hypothetical protein